jgi:hypothetical protein
VVLLSSLPEIGWIISRRSKDVEERVSEAETIVEKAVEDKDEEARSDDLHIMSKTTQGSPRVLSNDVQYIRRRCILPQTNLY